MATFDKDRDDAILEEEEQRSAPRQGNRPLLVAGVGLTLMLLGYAATTYVPGPSLRERDHTKVELPQGSSRPAPESSEARSARGGEQGVLPARHAPYQLPGRLAIYGGLALFILGGVQMYRSSPPSRDLDSEEG